jgi:beta-xylosidase
MSTTPPIGTTVQAYGNPIITGLGVCDPHVRVVGDDVYLYATHDADPANTFFAMHDWWIWRSRDLLTWELVSLVRPEDTYWGQPSSECWAVDAASRDGRWYLYFSRGPREIGVVVADRPDGPWSDPIGRPLIPEGLVDAEARDPAIHQEPDGTSYLTFGTFEFFIARLDCDMVSLAEPPVPLTIDHKSGPYGDGLTDDKPCLHRHDDTYYLSWGCYYATSNSLHGPYTYRGSFITVDATDPELRDPDAAENEPGLLTLDRHGSFFDLHGQSYFICNDQFWPGTTPYFRDSVISYVRYRTDGTIDPLRLSTIGVGQYDARHPIPATDYFRIDGTGTVRETAPGDFTVDHLTDGTALDYPNIRNAPPGAALTVHGTGQGAHIEVRHSSRNGDLLGTAAVGQPTLMPKIPDGHHLDLSLIIRAGPGPVSLRSLELAAG